ncbi:nephrin-like [Patiria miniata]|uniref:receptor protein-tyrosine kinase n=1 Tax=Patiria miniata TaxID=46514 RepID=A0A914AQI6_PATMI|nr:nephrin-like [Patiria miniata]
MREVPPSTIAVSYDGTSYGDGNIFPIVAGSNRQFTCTTPGVKPAASFTWTLPTSITTDQPLGSQTDTPNSGDSRLTDSTNTITVDIAGTPATAQLTCGATNRQDGLTDTEIDLTVTLQVRVPPSVVKLSDSDGEKTQGATVTVDQGSSHTFSCLVQGTRPAATIQWLVDDVMQSNGVGIPTSTETNQLFDTTGTWTFTPSRANHKQEVKCAANTAESQPPYSNVAITLDINGPPDTPVISGIASMTENVPATLTCTADMGYPNDWTLVWSNGGSPGPTTSSSASGDRYSFTGTLDYTPMRQDNGNIITCVAQRDSGMRSSEGRLPIDVQFCAGAVSVSCPSSTASGSIVQLSCNSGSSNPATSLVWSKNDVVQSNPSQPVFTDGDYGGRETTLRLTTGALTKADNGAVYQCCLIKTSLCNMDKCDSCSLNVEYRPEFSLPTIMPTGPIVKGGSIVLSCSAEANPQPPDFITWEKVGSPDSLTSVYSDGTSTLTLSSINRDDAGPYRCRGNNGVPPVVFSGSVDVIVHYEVSILNKVDTSVGAKDGYDATLVCEGKGNPLPRMTWLRPDGVELTNETEPGRIFQYDTIPEGDDVFGFTIRSTLHINRVTGTGDYGSYTCNSGNGIGMVDTLTIVLNDKVTPLPPENVSIDQGTVTATSVTITWRPGIDVGEPQWFYVNIREVDTTTGFDPSTRVRISDGVVMHVIDGLSPYTKYEIEVYAENANSVSQNVRRTVTTLPDTPEKLDISVTTNQETGIISVDGIPQDGDTSSCLRLDARLTNQDDWFDYGECLESNTDLALREARSRYCYGDLCSQATTALTVAGQSSNAGLIAGIAILAIILLLSVALNAVVIMYAKRRGLKPETKKRISIPKFKPEHKGGVTNEAVEYQDLDVPLQILAVGGSPNPAASTYASISETLAEFSREKLTIVRELGQGAFGKVLLGNANGIVQQGTVTQVAVKTLRDDADITERGDLLRELDFMKKLPSHSNVVKLLGFCIDRDPIYIIMEYMSKGQLKELLTSSRGKGKLQVYSNLHGRSKSLTSKDLIKFATDVADGMAFLASHQCIHRDLAARNVLVGENMICKVSDFGLARDVTNMRVYQRKSEARLPVRWMALESVVDDVYTTESDLWSYGILLWEIVTLGARPYPTMSFKTMISKLQEGYRMPRPEHCQDELYQMMLACWEEEPTARPSFTEIGQKLEKLLEGGHDYITLSDYQEFDYEVTIPDSPDEKV